VTHQILAIVIKEMQVLWRDREALVLLFAMPLFFILVMSWALEGVYEAGTRDRPIDVLVVNEDQGEAVGKILSDLEAAGGLHLLAAPEGGPLSRGDAERLIRKGSYSLALVFGPGVFDALAKGDPGRPETGPEVLLLFDPAANRPILSSIQGTIEAVVQRHVLAARLGPFMGGAEGEAFQSLPDRVRALPVAGKARARRPTSTEQHVPAYAIFGVFFIVLTLASGMLREKQDGTFRRVLTAPLTRTALLLGKLVPYYLINLVQIALMFGIGVAVYGIRLGNLCALAVVSLALAAAANGLGLLVASIGRTEAQVNGLSVLLAVTLSALGGMMVPTFVMPDGLRLLSRFTPHAWALDGYHDAMIRGLGVVDVLPEAGVLAGFAVFFFAVALWRFRFDGN